ncbi:hypothetical protein [Neisseria weixii]|nr:hypothetical protein [Neisseria weixii]
MILCEAFVIKPPPACIDVVMNHALENVGHWGCREIVESQKYR